MIYTGTVRDSGAGIVFIDTTVKSALPEWRPLAPTWELVMGSKRGLITWEQYTEGYLAKLRQEYAKDKSPFVEAVNLAAQSSICLCCYCSREKAQAGRCHRVLLAEVLVKVARSMGITLLYSGEVPKPPR